MRAIEIELARRGERLEHIHKSLDTLRAEVQILNSSIISFEKTVLVKFSEMNGRELQMRRVAVVASTVVSLLVAGASAAIAAIF